MKVLHCSWIPEITDAFIQQGDFWVWVEDETESSHSASHRHPRCLAKSDLIDLFESTLGLTVSAYERRFNFANQNLALPTANSAPLFSPEFEHGADNEVTTAVLKTWEVDAYRQTRPINQLADLRFLALCHGHDHRLAADFQFWFHLTQSVKKLILRDRYIPALIYKQMEYEQYELYAGWEIVSESLDKLVLETELFMPEGCAVAGEQLYNKPSLIRHCSEVLIHRTITQSTSGNKLDRRIRDTFLENARQEIQARSPWKIDEGIHLYFDWLKWRKRLNDQKSQAGFTLLFQLQESQNDFDPWRLEILVAPKEDPSLQLSLSNYWTLDTSSQSNLASLCGPTFMQNLLLALGQAARIYGPLWLGLDQPQPTGIDLTIEEAFHFLQRDAWVLEDAGFTVLIPAWWSPQGRRRAKIRLNTTGASNSGANRRNTMDLNSLISYKYEFAIGEENLDEAEWVHLVESKAPLVKFRGRWLALDRDRMREMLDFWRTHQKNEAGMSLPELIRKSAEDPEFFEIDPVHALSSMLSKLRDHNQLEPTDNPAGLKAELREYQKRGLAWIAFLEQLGLNGCLADDMGLGKTIQVLARLIQERHNQETVPPTLLVAPTSVIGNWKKEIERFAPILKAFIHHGAIRLRDIKSFSASCQEYDVVITSYALARRDEKLLSHTHWHRIVLDEAQNIKNPTSAQTKAVLKLSATHRLALTGTPVENRLLDLWSIFNFLNPGYLGRQSQFRQRYELPIQRDNDPNRADILKRLIEPFVLRRIKTDPEIIRDLPEKMENHQFCNLSKEQASLYEAVVRDVESRIGNTDGISRQGLILSTLTRLKQICNHPSQFLHDGSTFSSERSPKLERLCDMLNDVMEEGESALVFTQFAEIGGQLEKYLRVRMNCPVFYLHGAVPASKRESMIAEFQDLETGPSIFLLSLRAGGVGINLTKANHVFHFDRWWNPAVEDQATDRAFRIGQRRDVFVHKFITLGTLEEKIDRLIEEKKQVASMIVGNDESWLTKLDNETFKELIALNRFAVID
jgi:SNF2 family DNA or RNA helicase